MPSGCALGCACADEEACFVVSSAVHFFLLKLLFDRSPWVRLIVACLGTLLWGVCAGCHHQAIRLPAKLSYRGPVGEFADEGMPVRERVLSLREEGLLGSRQEGEPRLAQRLAEKVKQVGNRDPNYHDMDGGGVLRSRDSDEPGLLERAAKGTPLFVREVSSNGETSRLVRRASDTGSKGEIPAPKPNLLGKVPSNDKDWVPELKVLPRAEFGADSVTVRNVRNCEFLTYRDCLVNYYDETYYLKDLKTVDFIVVPFQGNHAIAHTMVSFGFEGGQHVGISAEVRLSQGQAYDATMGLFGQFELTYVVADERDLIRSRTEHRNVDVYMYRSTATPEQARKLFIDMLRRVNQLHDTPEFYDTLTNNCTTNIVRHINHLAPNKVPYDYRVLFPGYADRLAYELGLIDNSLPFAEVKRRARINEVALQYKDSPDFSAKIRGETVKR